MSLPNCVSMTVSNLSLACLHMLDEGLVVATESQIEGTTVISKTVVLKE
jgi:hypothetical protein